MIDINKIIENKNNTITSNGNVKIDSIIIEQKGNIENYFWKYESMHELKSCAKLLVAFAIRIAIDRKMCINGIPLTLDTKVFPVIKNLVNITNKSNIEKIKKWTIKNLLTHTTGYEQQMSSEKYICNIDTSNLLEYDLNYDIPYEVGERFAYNNAEPYILSAFFQEAFGINLSDFVNKNIFEKLNIKEYKWENYGPYCAASTALYLKHSDFHKIGQLLLNDGIYNGQSIIPKWWIQEMCKIQFETPSAYKQERVLPKIGVGYFTFISRDNFVFRDGANGQYIILNKKDKLLITIMSSEKEMQYVTEILRGLI